MTRLAALLCPACHAALEPAGTPGERVLCCGACPTAVDVAHDGLHRYPVSDARVAADLPRGLLWALHGKFVVVDFAASEPAVTPLGKFVRAEQAVSFKLTVPIGERPVQAHAWTLERVGKPVATKRWASAEGPLPTGTLGRREAERVVQQVAVTLITRAKGELHRLELAVEIEDCAVVRVL